jgi:hypothetical protein
MGHRYPEVGALTVSALFAPNAAVAANSDPSTNPTVSIANSVGEALVVLQAGAASAGSSPTLDVKLQHCDTAGGSFVDVPGGAFAQVTDATDSIQSMVIRPGTLKNFLAVAVTVGGSEASFPGVAVSVAHQPG